MLINSKFAIFIISCDKSKDIFLHFKSAYKKNFSKHYRVFIGLNSFRKVYHILNSKVICSKKSNWKYEVKNQLLELKKKGVAKTLILLDDFIFEQVDNSLLKKYISYAFKKNLNYLCLRMPKRSIINSSLLNKNYVTKIKKNYPYFSSLQAAIWDINYFIKILDKSKSIWDFERKKSLCDHYYSTHPPFKYKHVVEKGKWIFYAKQYCLKNCGFFIPSKRKKNSSVIFIIKYFISRFLVLIFGQRIMK